MQVRVNPEALARIAQTPPVDSAFTAVSAGELKKVYKDIGSSVGYVKVFRDITTWFVGIALRAAVRELRVVARLVQPPAVSPAPFGPAQTRAQTVTTRSDRTRDEPPDCMVTP